MKYILYFGGYDNDTYFYKDLKQLLESWDCKTLEDFKEKYDGNFYCIYEIKKVVIGEDKCFI